MKKGIAIASFMLFSAISLMSQNAANAWIDYDQNYYKFPVSEDGLYRISYQALVDANIPLSTIDPRNFQLYARGEEVPVFIKGENDGVFNATDYIEFYAHGNDGFLDTALYRSKANQPNPYYSLFNDTLSYFLSWNNSTDNLRFEEENAIDFSNYFNTPFVWNEVVQFYSSNYYDGEILVNDLLDPEYVASEGWMDQALTLGRSRSKVLQTPNRYTAGPQTTIEMKVAGESNWRPINNGDHHLQVSVGNQLIDTIFEGYDLIEIKRSFPSSELNSGNNIIRFESIDDRNSEVDRSALSYIKLTYPQNLNFGNQSYYEFLLDDANNQNAQYLEISSFNGGSTPVLYDLSNQKKVRVVETITDYKVIIPNGNGRKKCVISNENQVSFITDLNPVNQSGQFTDYRLELQDSSFFIITHEDLFPPATTYAAYRRSTGHNSLVALIDELYDQYAFGIEKHPMAIRNFMEDAMENWNYPPTHLFLVGKSVNAKDHRKNALNFQRNLVPTLGNPATDNLFLSGLKGTLLEPPIPIGRLSARSPDQVDNYLNKVIEYEAAPAAKWMKRALHFAGGKTALETNRHETFLNGFAQDFQSPPFGGETRLFRKSTSSPFQVTLSDSIRTLMNEGVSLLTFFGHSSATGGFDISIDTPDKLNNRGKYHVLLANSCFAGNTHQGGVESTSEQYVLEKNKGAIAFIASGSLGFSFYLNQYSSAFYENFAVQNYGRSLAENMRQAVKAIQTQNPSEPIKSVCLEMTLQGDPAIVLNSHQLPDFKVAEELAKVQPKEVTSDLDSFRISFVVENIGRAVSDSIQLRLSRSYSDPLTPDSVRIFKIPAVFYEETLSFNFPVEQVNGSGLNTFTLTVDPFNEIAELSELNNVVELEVLIRSGEIIPVYPYNFSIVGSQSPTLKASTAFAFEQERGYVFELDTISSFNSGFKQTETIYQEGGVLNWQPNALANMPDSAVYFWRVSRVPQSNEDYNWRSSSFQFISGETGWAQDHFNQFEKNTYQFIEQDKPQRKYEYTDRLSELYVKTIGSPNGNQLNDIFYALDADTRERSSCFSSPSFLIAVIDSLTFDSWQTPYNGQNLQNDFGQANVGAWCLPSRDRAEAVFSFQTNDTAQLIAMRDFLNNEIPNGAYVVAYNWLNIDFDAIRAFDPTVLQAFGNLGSNEIPTAPAGHPFIFTAQKGRSQSSMEVIGDSTTAIIDLRRNLTTNADFGGITSSVFGPAENFRKLAYSFNSLEKPSEDSVLLELLGINQQGQEQVVFSSNKMRLDTNIIGFINSEVYNRFKFRFTGYDRSLQTPPQIDRWQLSYDEFPDIALSPNDYFLTNKDTLQRGDSLELEFAVANVSKTDMDSLLISYRLLNESNQISELASPRIAPVKGDSVVISKITLPTTNMVGRNTLLIELNPNQDQKELNTFNNFGQFDFTVLNDNLNPLLDVTFDGRHIINREIVSSSPQIDITLRDDNPYLVIDDTSSFSIYLTAPGEQEELMNYGVNASYDLTFKPATSSENKAMVSFNPKLTKDGIYQLRVRAKDKTGNASSQQDYRVEFEVVTKSTVTRLMNYPNPFSTSTRFVFTLTGNRVPDQVQIQIMTITGKVVREIDQFELGPIHIGNNISEFAWDGKDQFGDQLANGVYLYRVKMRINGSNIEHRSTNADQYFTREFGKMYLLR